MPNNRKPLSDKEAWDLAYRTALVVTNGDEDLAFTAAQNAVQKLIEHNDSINEWARYNWIRTTARRDAIAEIRKRSPDVPGGFYGSELRSEGPPTGSGQGDRAERAAEEFGRRYGSTLGSLVADRLVVEDALGFLSAELRRIVEMRYFDKDDAPEIAAALGLKPGTVRAKLMAARETLRPVLGDAVDDLLS